MIVNGQSVRSRTQNPVIRNACWRGPDRACASGRSSIVRARRGAPDGRGGRPLGLEQLVSRRSLIGPVAPVDANGISQVPWRSVPCLCSAPGGPRSSRRDLACGGLVDAACPGFHKPKASADRKISRLTQGFSICCLRFTSDVAATHAKLASGWRAAPIRGGRRTLWTTAKGFRSHFPPPFQDWPCSNKKVPIFSVESQTVAQTNVCATC